MAIGLPQLIIESNSIGLGYYADNTGAPSYNPVGSAPFPDGWVNVMYNALGGASWGALTNNSINGGKTSDLTTADPGKYAALSSTRLANIVFFFEVTNDYFGGANPIATCLANYQAWYNGWRAATGGTGVGGNTIVVFGTPIPRVAAGAGNGTGGIWEVDRLWIRQQVQQLGIADEFCDFGQDAIMGAPATLNNITYIRTDFIHPMLGGHAILAKQAAASVKRAMSRMAFVYSTEAAAQTALNTIDTAAGYPKNDPLAGGLPSARTQHYCPIRPYGTQYALLADATTVAALASSSPPQPILLPAQYGS